MKKTRHRKIVEIIEKFDVETQEELAKYLKDAGVVVTQATVSRDIRELKLSKIPSGNGKQKYVVLKQDDSYYEAYRIYAQESLDTFLYVYMTFYNVGDYAGVCALSKGIEYSDEQQIEWEKQNVSLTQMEVEEGESEDEKKVKCVFQFTDGEKILYLHLVRENNNWYVNGLPQ